MCKSEQNFIVEKIDQVDRAILATDCDNINDRALNYGLDWALHCELVHSLLLNHVPEFHLFFSVEKHLVDVGDGMNHSSQVLVLELCPLDHLACLSLENNEFTLLSQREDEVASHDKDLDGLFVASVLRMPMHFVPSHDLIRLSKASVDEAGGRSLEIGDLLCNVARHEDKAQLGRAVDIEGIFANDRGNERVFATLVNLERNRARVVPEGPIRLEQYRRV